MITDMTYGWKLANYQNLDSFSDDLNKQIRVAMERYIDTMHGTAATVAQSTEVARHAIQAINLDQDSRSSVRLVHPPSELICQCPFGGVGSIPLLVTRPSSPCHITTST
jgi:hypothetical protein